MSFTQYDGIGAIPRRPAVDPSPPPRVTHPTRVSLETRRPVVTQAPDEARAATTERQRDLTTASVRVDALREQRQAAPSGLRHEFDEQISRANSDVSRARGALTDAMVEEFRLTAQTTPPDAARTVYEEQSAVFAASPVDRSARPDYDQAVADARLQALAADPANLNEAKWQRNAEIWEAQQAQWDFEQTIGDDPVVQLPTGELADPALQAMRAEVESEWQDVDDAFATEYGIASESMPAALPSGDDPLAVYHASVVREKFDPRYRERILSLAQPDYQTEALNAAIDARVAADVATVEAALDEGGSAVAFDAMVAVKDGLVDTPITVAGSLPNDAVVLALAQDRMDRQLRPIQERIAAGAPADLRALAARPAESIAEQYDRANAVSGRLALYSEVLPADLVPQLVADSRESWAPSIAFLGERHAADDSSHPHPRSRGNPSSHTDSFNQVTTHFIAVGEALAASPDGDAALGQIADEFAQAVDSGDIGAFDEAFGVDGVGEGHGANLLVEVVNRLAGNEATRDVGDDLLRGLKDGNERWAGNASQTLEDFALNRDALTKFIENFPGGTRALGVSDLRDPTDVTTLELQDAISDYLERHPEVRELDLELLDRISDDGVHLLRLELALQGLSPEALSLDHADEIVDPIRDLLAPDDLPGATLAQIYSGTPGVNAELTRFTALSANVRAEAAATSAIEPSDVGTLQYIAESQGFMSMPRNARFLLMELLHNDTGFPGLRTPLLSKSNTMQGVGAAFFGVAATSAYLDAAGLGIEGLSGMDRAIAGVRGSNFAFIGARDVLKLGHALTGMGSLQAIYQATGHDTKVYLGNHVVLAKGLQLTSRGIFVGGDAYILASDIQDQRNGGVITGDILSLAGSVVMLGEAGILAGVGPFAAASSWAGLVAWAGTALWTAGAITKYQFDRVERANRYETADQRRFLAHFGTRDADGNLLPVDLNTEVSDAADHAPEVRTVRDGVPGVDDIVYTGLSADAVDELMNYSGSPDNPVAGIAALDVLAAEHGIDVRRFYLEWFEGTDPVMPGLTHDQRKALTVAAQGVDPASVDAGITDDTLTRGWTQEWQEFNSGYSFLDPERLTEDDRFSLLEYVYDQKVVSYGGDYGTELQTDPRRLRVLLGLQPPGPGEQAPTPEVQAAAEKVLGDTAVYGRDVVNDGGMRPATVDELVYWMQLHEYPPLPGPDPALAIGPRPTPIDAPVDAPVDEGTREPSPTEAVDHDYVVQPGDNLWDIARRTITPTDVRQLMDYHNENNPPAARDFDPDRADDDFFSARDPDDERRDPDLILPGEIITVADVADIRRG